MKIVIISAVSVLWLVSQLSFAEMKIIDETDMANVTGQAGLTIDMDFGFEIGEFMYKDAGSIVMQGLRMGGMDWTSAVGTSYDASAGIVADPLDPGKGNSAGFTTTYGGTTGLNNVRVDVDVAGVGETFKLAWLDMTSVLLCNPCSYAANDGDLIISATASDPRISSMVGALAGTSVTIADFGLEMDKFALKDSTYIAGDDLNNLGGTALTAQETTIISDLKMEGWLGGFDLIIENKGNGFTNGIADSKIKINSFFRIEEMEYDFDIAGIRYEKIKIHNQRGSQLIRFDLNQNNATGWVTRSETFAQGGTHLYAVKDKVLNLATLSSPTGTNPSGYVDGIAINTRFFGDMDIGHMSFGDTRQSIGEQYWTDMDIITNATFSAH